MDTELNKEGRSFGVFPDVFGNNQREFVVHTVVLVLRDMARSESRRRSFVL